MQFYYTDGIDLQPNVISGVVTITEASEKAISGKLVCIWITIIMVFQAEE